MTISTGEAIPSEAPALSVGMNRETALELFGKACGLAPPLTLSYRPAQPTEGATSSVIAASPFLFIGRNPANEVALNDSRVSRRHAFLQAVGGRVVVIDLESRTKTFWDEEAEARPWGWLEPGQALRIGASRIERTDRPRDASAIADLADPFGPWEGPASTDESWPRAVFELPFRVGGVAPTWVMPGVLALVGRENACQLVLSDGSVSRHHACLVRTPTGTWIVDLGAREGVHVNGTRVRWAWLADGDLVRFGLFTLVMRYDRRPEGIGREDVPLEAGAFPTGPPDLVENGDEPEGGTGRELALRPSPRPPAVKSATGPPRRIRPPAPPAVPGDAWEPVLGAGPSPYALWQQQMQLMESFHRDMTMMVQMFIAMHREFQSSVRGELRKVQKLTEELARLNARLLQAPGPVAPEPPRQDVKARRASREAPPAPEPAPAPRKADRREPRPAKADDPAPAPPPPRESAELYADITRRITELQRERRGYWQRILKSING